MRWDAVEADAYRRVEALRDSQRSMSLTDSAGGHMVPVALDPAILLTNAGSANPIRQLARTVRITGDTWNGVSSAGATAEWLAEATEAADGSPTVGQPTVPTHKYSCFVPYSVEIEGDGLNFVSELQRVMVDAVDNLHATAFATGSGQPTGIITALAAASSSMTIAGAGSEALAAADFYALQNALGPRYQPNAGWAANLAILNTARQFETTNGALKFPSLQDTPPTLLGQPVHEGSSMDGAINPAATESNRVVVYGDWSKYVIADRVGTTVEIVNHIVGENGRPTGERGLWVWGRVGADSVNDNAFRVLNVATTA
ncbi:phage major capsid protein [Gordonia paraffinivorans]|uniref:phage major capsid protein n=1 Tax=Gordonia paraffinivorans TaxID=175628 RepID=UPI003FCE0882